MSRRHCTVDPIEAGSILASEVRESLRNGAATAKLPGVAAQQTSIKHRFKCGDKLASCIRNAAKARLSLSQDVHSRPETTHCISHTYFLDIKEKGHARPGQMEHIHSSQPPGRAPHKRRMSLIVRRKRYSKRRRVSGLKQQQAEISRKEFSEGRHISRCETRRVEINILATKLVDDVRDALNKGAKSVLLMPVTGRNGLQAELGCSKEVAYAVTHRAKVRLSMAGECRRGWGNFTEYFRREACSRSSPEQANSTTMTNASKVSSLALECPFSTTSTVTNHLWKFEELQNTLQESENILSDLPGLYFYRCTADKTRTSVCKRRWKKLIPGEGSDIIVIERIVQAARYASAVSTLCSLRTALHTARADIMMQECLLVEEQALLKSEVLTDLNRVTPSKLEDAAECVCTKKQHCCEDMVEATNPGTRHEQNVARTRGLGAWSNKASQDRKTSTCCLQGRCQSSCHTEALMKACGKHTLFTKCARYSVGHHPCLLGDPHLPGWTARLVELLGPSVACARSIASVGRRILRVLLDDAIQISAELRPMIREISGTQAWGCREEAVHSSARQQADLRDAIWPLQDSGNAEPLPELAAAELDLKKARLCRVDCLLEGLVSRASTLSQQLS